MIKRISSVQLRKVSLINRIIKYLSYDFYFVLFIILFDNKPINLLECLKCNVFSSNFSFLSLNCSSIIKLLNNKFNYILKYNCIKLLLGNKNVKMFKFRNKFEMFFFFDRLLSEETQTVSIVGGVVDNIFYSFDDLVLIKKEQFNYNKLKFNYYNSFSFNLLLPLIKILNFYSINNKFE